jgi:hypothetical protein
VSEEKKEGNANPAAPHLSRDCSDLTLRHVVACENLEGKKSHSSQKAILAFGSKRLSGRIEWADLREIFPIHEFHDNPKSFGNQKTVIKSHDCRMLTAAKYNSVTMGSGEKRERREREREKREREREERERKEREKREREERREERSREARREGWRTISSREFR